MAGPTVTLTFAGDSAQLEQQFDKVGAGATTMGDKVRASGESFDRVGGGIDTTKNKAGDLESGLRGVTDSMSGVAAISRGDMLGGLTDLAGGAEALATGFGGLVVPALKNMGAWLKTTRIGMLAQAAASKVVAAAQWLLNAAMSANPIGIIIVLIAALVAAFIWAYHNSEDFRRIVDAAFAGVQRGATLLWEGIRWAFDNIVDFIGRAVDNIGGFFRGMWDGLGYGLRTALNGAIGLINGAIGGINSLIWGVNNIPGVSIPSLPRLPYLHQGGVVPGSPGQETLAMLQAGERVTPAGVTGGEPRTVRVDLGPEIMRMIRKQVRAEGGDVQLVLGRAA